MFSLLLKDNAEDENAKSPVMLPLLVLKVWIERLELKMQRMRGTKGNVMNGNELRRLPEGLLTE